MTKEQFAQADNTEEAVYREVEEEVQQPAPDKKKLKCALVIGITEDNQMFVNIEGDEQNLIHIEGLMGYARKHVDQLWNNALEGQGQEG